MNHEQTKMTMVGRSRHAFKNYLVRKSYWVKHYKCPVCQRKATAMNNIVAHKTVICDGTKTHYQPRNQ